MPLYFSKGGKRRKTTMRAKACQIVTNYLVEHIDETDKVPVFQVYIVWQCKTLQNWQYLISTENADGMYYEVTYNGDKDEWYLDDYKKFENRCIPGKSVE